MPRKPAQSWFRPAAEKMVRERKGLFQALLELQIDGITSREAENVQRTRAFQEILRDERHKYQQEVATDPGFSKTSVIGQMAICAQQLMDEGEWDKAADVLQKLARLTGWQGADSNVNIFADLKPADIDALKKEFSLGNSQKPGESGTKQTLSN